MLSYYPRMGQNQPQRNLAPFVAPPEECVYMSVCVVVGWVLGWADPVLHAREAGLG